jgi:tetratricopeptide (TPR) repeat protein/DNA-binding CsgD family transcriptional regulator
MLNLHLFKKSILIKSSVILLFYLLSIYPVLSQKQATLNPEEILLEANNLLSTKTKKAIVLAKSVYNNKISTPEYFVKSTVVLGTGYRKTGEYDSSIYFINKGIEKAKLIYDTASIIKLFSNRGVAQYLKANYQDAATDFKLAGQIKENTITKNIYDTSAYFEYAKILNNTASAFIKTGQKDSALTYFIRSLKIREQYNAPERMLVVSKLNVGSIYLALGDNANSEVWINEALNGAKQLKDTALMAKGYNNLGIIYKKSGDTLQAIQCYKNCLVLSVKPGTERDKSIALQNLGLLLSNQTKYDEAYSYFIKALEHNNTIHVNNSRLHLAISRLFMAQNKYNQAIVHGNLSLKLARKSGNLEVQYEDLILLSKAYKNKKQYKQSLNCIEDYLVLKDSIDAHNNQQYIQGLKAEFENETKENKIKFLKELNRSEHDKAEVIQSRQQLIILIILLAFALVVAIALQRINKRKKEKELYLIEKKLMETDLHNKELSAKEMQMENNYKTKQLTTHALNMIQRNQTLNDISKKLEKLSLNIDNESKIPFKGILKDISRMQRTEKEWELFKKYFENINKDFNTKLRAINPDLSVSDYRLAALISLNLNIKESAAVLNITPSSVKLARHRLRKKLNINTSEDIYVFLTKL